MDDRDAARKHLELAQNDLDTFVSPGGVGHNVVMCMRSIMTARYFARKGCPKYLSAAEKDQIFTATTRVENELEEAINDRIRP